MLEGNNIYAPPTTHILDALVPQALYSKLDQAFLLVKVAPYGDCQDPFTGENCMAKPKYDTVVEAVHYQPDGQVAWVRAYQRRGPTFTDWMILKQNLYFDHFMDF